MKRFHQAIALLSIASGLAITSCSDDNSPIGADLVAGDISITVDSLTMSLNSYTEQAPKFDSRSQTTLVGRITCPEYGDLNCEYFARMMCASALPLPDSITDQHIDSVRLMIRIPRQQLTGDSLAPQQLRVYLMNQRFNDVKADTVTNEFNPASFYNPANELVSKTYTLTTVGASDIISTSSTLTLPIKLSGEYFTTFGPGLVERYRTEPDLFTWPKNFSSFLPGIYVKPTFGSGCIANVSATQFMLYYHTRYISTEYVDGEVVNTQKVRKDSVSLISTAPEVLSANRIIYRPAASLEAMQKAGKCIITTPGGFRTHVSFPAKNLLDKYIAQGGAASMISNLTLAIPASAIPNDYGIGLPPYLLMVKASVAEQFFNEGRLPDGKDSFWAGYNSSTGEYKFTSFRDYIIDLARNGEVTEDDTEFVLIPVNLSVETTTNSYSGTTTTTVTACTPYISSPTMCELHTDRANIVFTFSVQNAKIY